MRLSERAVIATLHIGTWTGTMHDNDITEKVSEWHQAAARDAGQYSKQLVAKKFLAHVGKIASSARALHRTLTLPWADGGQGILSTMGFHGYTEAMRLKRLAFEAATGEFVAARDGHIAEAEVRLGTMFDPNDYPSAEDIAKKFHFDVEIGGVPEAGDFRAELSDKQVAAITKEIERRSQRRLEEAVGDVYRRIADVTGRMAEGLRKYEPKEGGERAKGVFRDSLVMNITELADLIPTLNITNDPKLVDLERQLREQLIEHSPEVL